jgi:Mg2+ and Co2+ transporter CorA
MPAIITGIFGMQVDFTETLSTDNGQYHIAVAVLSGVLMTGLYVFFKVVRWL